MFALNDWFAWAVLSAIFAAMTAILAKVGLEGVDPDYANLLRTVVIGAILGVLVLAQGTWSNPASLGLRSAVFLVLSGLAAGGSWICYFRALKLGDASQVAPVDKASVLLVAIFASLFLGERPNASQWCGIAMIGAGVVLLGWRR